MNLNYKLLVFSLGFLWACTNEQTTSDNAGVEGEVQESLPFHEVALKDLSPFKSTTENWKAVSGVFSDYQTEHSLETEPGTGVLVNLVTEEDKDHLFTEMEHGDLELELEFMTPKGTNSGIYLQG
ncbi:MAG: family 16 glycoside hydrolase, partial [Cyclobacteriaceae bacterium]